jgi:hypothetical protein
MIPGVPDETTVYPAVNGWTMKQWALVFAETNSQYTSIEDAVKMQEVWRGQHSHEPLEQPLIETRDGKDPRKVDFTQAARFFTAVNMRRVDRARKIH